MSLDGRIFTNNASATIITASVSNLTISTPQSSPFNVLPLSAGPPIHMLATLVTPDSSTNEIIKLTDRGTSGPDVLLNFERGIEGAQVPDMSVFVGGKIEVRTTADTLDKTATMINDILLDANGNILTDGNNVLTR